MNTLPEKEGEVMNMIKKNDEQNKRDDQEIDVRFMYQIWNLIKDKVCMKDEPKIIKEKAFWSQL
jgi:hypothetical protein